MKFKISVKKKNQQYRHGIHLKTHWEKCFKWCGWIVTPSLFFVCEFFLACLYFNNKIFNMPDGEKKFGKIQCRKITKPNHNSHNFAYLLQNYNLFSSYPSTNTYGFKLSHWTFLVHCYGSCPFWLLTYRLILLDILTMTAKYVCKFSQKHLCDVKRIKNSSFLQIHENSGFFCHPNCFHFQNGICSLHFVVAQTVENARNHIKLFHYLKLKNESIAFTTKKLTIHIFTWENWNTNSILWRHQKKNWKYFRIQCWSMFLNLFYKKPRSTERMVCRRP